MKRALTEQSRQSLALKPSSSLTYRVETDSGKLTSMSSFLHFLINPMRGCTNGIMRFSHVEKTEKNFVCANNLLTPRS